VDSAKFKALLSLVAEKMMSVQVVDQGIVSPKHDDDGLEVLERVLARDQLYKREIVNKVFVSTPEIEHGLERYA
jgi:hypothetical protein